MALAAFLDRGPAGAVRGAVAGGANGEDAGRAA